MGSRSKLAGKRIVKKQMTSRRRSYSSRDLRFETMESRHLLSGQGFVQGTVYYDANLNNVVDPGEALAGATISLLSQNELTKVGSPVTTGPDGSFMFSGLSGGIYHVKQTTTPSWIRSEHGAD